MTPPNSFNSFGDHRGYARELRAQKQKRGAQNELYDITHTGVCFERHYALKVDELGKAVHEGCYLLKVSLRRVITPSRPKT